MLFNLLHISSTSIGGFYVAVDLKYFLANYYKVLVVLDLRFCQEDMATSFLVLPKVPPV